MEKRVPVQVVFINMQVTETRVGVIFRSVRWSERRKNNLANSYALATLRGREENRFGHVGKKS